MKVYENVRAVRIAKGIKGSHVAEHANLTRQEYHDRETGKVRLSVEEMKIIAPIIGENIEVFFDDKLTKSVLRKLKRGVGGGTTANRNRPGIPEAKQPGRDEGVS